MFTFLPDIQHTLHDRILLVEFDTQAIIHTTLAQPSEALKKGSRTSNRRFEAAGRCLKFVELPLSVTKLKQRDIVKQSISYNESVVMDRVVSTTLRLTTIAASESIRSPHWIKSLHRCYRELQIYPAASKEFDFHGKH
jgi:hypothetical protein